MRYRPIGFVIKARAATNSTSCNQSIERIRMCLEFLRPEHGHEQVSEQQEGNHAHNKVFHRFLLQLLAAADIQTADHEEQDGDSDIDEICHTRFKLLIEANSIHAMAQAGTAAGRRVIKNEATGVKNSLKCPGATWPEPWVLPPV
jgi:hypothetical protein